MYKKKLLTILISAIIFLLLILPQLMPVPVYAASLTLNPSSGTVGSTVLISGKGFAGRSGTIYWDDKIIATNVIIADNGNLDYNLTIPTTNKGTHSIRVTDNSNWSASNATTDFVVLPTITAFPTTGKELIEVTITGNGFGKEERDIRITWDGNVASISPIAADRLGKWSTMFTITKTTKGEHYISAQGNTTSASEIGKIKFIVAPYVQVTPLSGPVGTKLLIYGWGFRANEDGVSMTWDGELFIYNIRAELDGSLIVDGSKVPNVSRSYTGDTRETVYIPPATQGKHVLGVYGSSFTPRGIFNDTVIEVIPAIKLQTEPDIKGTQVTINGTGFASNEIITISLNKTATNTTATTDSTGSFNAILVTPTSKGKEYTIAASGNKGNSAQASFSSAVDRSMPTEVKLLSPAQGTKLAIFNSVGDALLGTAKYLFGIFDYLSGSQSKATRPPKPTFSWTAVSDTSGISYVLQISNDRDFTSIILDKKIPNRTEYTLSENDNFSSGRYSWRVKSVDYTGIESQWSQISEFEIISMPTHVNILTWLVLILILAAIVFGILTAWVNLKRYP